MSEDERRRQPSDAGEGFLSRWSRRKTARERGEAQNARAEPAAAAPADAPERGAPAGGPLDERSEEEILAELGLPVPEDLQPGDGVAGFMRAGVPEALKRRALRRLWKINPALGAVDGLVEYGEDYTDAALAVKTLQSVYEAKGGYGKLFASHDANADSADEDAPEAPAEEEAETAPAGDEAEDAAAPAAGGAGAAASRSSESDVDAAEPPPRRATRMTFDFDK